MTPGTELREYRRDPDAFARSVFGTRVTFWQLDVLDALARGERLVLDIPTPRRRYSMLRDVRFILRSYRAMANR